MVQRVTRKRKSRGATASLLFAGPVIVALNPFSDRKSPSMVKLYDDSTQEYYANMTSEELASTDHPHLFEVAAKAYNGVQEENGRSQAIVINGESGAGKIPK